MIAFLIGAALLILCSVAFIVWPLRRRAANADFSRQQLNAVIYRDQLAELERDRREGAVAQADFDQAQAELQRRLLEDTATETSAVSATAPVSRALPITLALALPVATVLLYLAIGMPQAIDAPAHQQRFTQDDIEKMITGLAAKLENEPQNFKGWAMLARSYKMMGRFPEAAQAYERTGEMLQTSAELLVDYADTLAAMNGFDAKSLELLEQAIKLEPHNLQGLWLRGTAAFEAKRYDQAITDWEVLLKVLPPESEEAVAVKGNIAEARNLQGKTGKVGADKTAAAATPSVATRALISGRVEVAADVAGKVPAGATLMVIARPADGSRMPVGVFMAKGALPADFTLDDSLAMSPDHLLSKHKELMVEARLSQSGQATPQAGDLFGPAQTIKLGAKNVRLKIDQVR